ncbi:MAG: UDP-N-acetylmuramoyl-tripeptide--D-alanyl-D-alanine ligase [bacterium]|nr:UDP-N-acetylmuramoyl-tripeptide--D-alanyl-D-alanine ligase [bacterium]
MITRILSRYRPLYIRSLIYMLQVCEYSIRDYVAWYGRTTDFSNVERRKTLIKTSKVYVLYVCAYAIVIALVAIAYYAMAFAEFTPRIVVLVCTALLAPYILAYVILIPLVLVRALQIPVEYVLIGQARKKLARHKGLKIAIAGSFGKTSMREILKTVLSEGARVASPPFSYNTPLGIARFIGELRGDEEVLIFELGEYYPGDIAKLCKLIDPHIGIITGINEAHLEKFGTLEKTASTIFELAEYLKYKPVYINGENEVARKNAKATLRNHILYSQEGVGDCRTENLKSDLRGTSFGLVLDGVKSRVKSKLLGLHTIGPLAVSAHIAYRLGFNRKQIEAGIGKTKAFSHRLEPHEDKSGVITLDDSYNGNPDGVHAIIDFLESLEGHRRWYVTPGLVEIGSRTAEVHKEIGRRIAAARLEKVVLIKNSVTPYIEQGLRETNYAGEILRFDDALQAYAALPHLTVKGDVVLLQNDWPDQYA